MPPIYVKGGVWTNAEDQILKAAVSKYGLNQWDRVSSLLPKKSAKQAKARWNEYLNPNVNKSDWTREEDEKLLRLVKLVPNQWRTIAPMMGRTATSCVERYQKLLDDVGGVSDELSYTGPGIEALPSQGPEYTAGGINLNPEGKPSRPDDETMEDEEKEMLAEATARLANTQGRKAQRKARERMLEETKRISLIQKRREMKAAGINVSLKSNNKRKKQEFDYIADIPNEIKPQKGLYDTNEEEEENLKEKEIFLKNVQHKGLSPREAQSNTKEYKKKEMQVDSTSINSDVAKLIEPLKKKPKLDLPSAGQSQEDNDVEMDIDERIMVTTKQLKAKQAKASSLIVDENDVDNLDNLDTKSQVETIKIERKPKVVPFEKIIAQLFATVPPPVNNPKPVELIKDDEEDEPKYVVKQVETVPSTFDRGEDIRKAKQRETLKLEQLKSSVALKKLPIINPSRIKPIADVDQLSKQIYDEVQKLVAWDYKQYIDATFSARPLEEIDIQSVEKVKQEIKAMDQMSSTAKIEPISEPPIFLAHSFETAEQIISTLHDLHKTNTQLETQIEDRLNSNEFYEKQRYLANNINEAYTEIQQATLDLSVYNKLANSENLAMHRRINKLTEMVNQVKEGEEKVHHLVQKILSN